ncbi:MAG: hypothetical protein WB566_09025 [Terriglobales bacterium]
MRQKIEMPVRIVALIAVVSIVVLTAGSVLAQAPAVPLEDQLKAQYTLVKMGADSGGAAVVEQGTILVIKKGGILSVPYGDQPVATKYQDGTVHSPNALMMGARGGLMGKFGKQQTTQLFQVGTKVYPARIAVNLPKDQVTIGVVACDSCNNVSPTTFYKADVVFQFAKGSLANANPSEIEDTISGLLALDDSADQGGGQQGGDNGNNNAQQGGNQGGGQTQQQQAPPPEPAQIEKGQTPEQVKAAIGNPDKIVNLGAKQIYVYKDIKVTFINGKVSDVQ